jgi:hypothetical protein
MLERKFEAKAREELEALKRDAALAAAASRAALVAESQALAETQGHADPNFPVVDSAPTPRSEASDSEHGGAMVGEHVNSGRQVDGQRQEGRHRQTARTPNSTPQADGIYEHMDRSNPNRAPLLARHKPFLPRTPDFLPLASYLLPLTSPLHQRVAIEG